jgi:nitrogen fixation protein FixH
VRAIRTRSRRRVERTGISPVKRHDEKRRVHREEVERQLKEEGAFLEELASKGTLKISEMGVLTAKRRLLFLQWIGRCTAHPGRSFVAADGTRVTLEKPADGSEAVLRCEDGELVLPDYRLTFSKEEALTHV